MRRPQMNKANTAVKWDELEDLRELEHNIYTERILSEEYFRKCVDGIKKWDRKELANIGKYSIPHKIPFKVRFKNFWNKVLKTLGYGRTERFI